MCFRSVRKGIFIPLHDNSKCGYFIEYSRNGRGCKQGQGSDPDPNPDPASFISRQLFTPLRVSCLICERGIITLLLSEATARVTSSPLGPSGFPTSINGTTSFMQLLRPKVWMSSMASLPLEYWLQSISKSWWLHLQTVSGTQPLLTSPIPVTTTSLGNHKSLPLWNLWTCILVPLELPLHSRPKGYVENTRPEPCSEPSHDCLDHGLWAPHEPAWTSPHILPHPHNQLHPPGAFLPFPKSRVLLLLGHYLHLPLYRRMGVRLIPFFLEISNSPPKMGLTFEKHHFVPPPDSSPFAWLVSL